MIIKAKLLFTDTVRRVSLKQVIFMMIHKKIENDLILAVIEKIRSIVIKQVN